MFLLNSYLQKTIQEKDISVKIEGLSNAEDGR